MNVVALLAIIAGIIGLVSAYVVQEKKSFKFYENLVLGSLIVLGYGMSSFVLLDDVLFMTCVITAVMVVKNIYGVRFCKETLPFLCVITVLRLCVVEPFYVPTASMEPTVPAASNINSMLLVKKYEIGPRIPFTTAYVNPRFENLHHGEIVVFKFPLEPNVVYTKRLIGKPGDTIMYNHENGTLTINGVVSPIKKVSENDNFVIFEEKIGDVTHRFQHAKAPKSDLDKLAHSMEFGMYISNMSKVKGCDLTGTGFVCKIPEKKYFMMGDNRDNSFDSRFWGYVDESQIIGNAVKLWQ